MSPIRSTIQVQPSNWKIRTKIISFSTLTVLVAVAVISQVNFANLSQTTVDNKGEELVIYAQSVMERAEEAVGGSVKALQSLALSPAVVAAAKEANSGYEGRSQEDIDAQIASQDKAWVDQDPSIEPRVQQIEKNDLSGDLRNFVRSFPEEVEVFATDIHGLNVAMTDRTGDYLQADEGWWKNAYNGGQGAISIGQVDYDESAKSYAINIGIPIRDPADQKVIGILRGTVDVSVVFNTLSQVKLGETGHADIIDKNGRILYSPDSALLMKTAPEEIGGLLETSQDGWLPGAVNLEGNNSILAYSFSKGSLGDSLGWMILLSQDLAEVKAPIQASLLKSTGYGAITVVLLTLLGFLFANSISRSLMLVSKLSTLLSTGITDVPDDEYQRLVKIARNRDEIGTTGRGTVQLIDYLHEMAGVAESISSGDLTVQFKPKGVHDRLGNAFEQMVAHLIGIVGQVVASSNQLGSASTQLASAAGHAQAATNQIARTMGEISKGTSQQAGSISQTAASVEQMARAISNVADGAQEQAKSVGSASSITADISASIDEVATNARAVTQNSAEAAESARSGVKIVQATIEGMERIRERVNISSQKVHEMGQRSGEIGSIVETIEEIASQTNLLALNAAIEAARAGDHGKGFAVVADEVRKLSERASGATKEIAILVKGIQRTVDEAVQAMSSGAQEVEGGVKMANQAGDALSSILKAAETVYRQSERASLASERMSQASKELSTAMDSVSAVVEENTASTEEMAAGASEVSHSIESIASVSEENSAAIEEISASAQEMSAQVDEVNRFALCLHDLARSLQSTVSKFKLAERV